MENVSLTSLVLDEIWTSTQTPIGCALSLPNLATFISRSQCPTSMAGVPDDNTIKYLLGYMMNQFLLRKGKTMINTGFFKTPPAYPMALTFITRLSSEAWKNDIGLSLGGYGYQYVADATVVLPIPVVETAALNLVNRYLLPGESGVRVTAHVPEANNRAVVCNFEHVLAKVLIRPVSNFYRAMAGAAVVGQIAVDAQRHLEYITAPPLGNAFVYVRHNIEKPIVAGIPFIVDGGSLQIDGPITTMFDVLVTVYPTHNVQVPEGSSMRVVEPTMNYGSAIIDNQFTNHDIIVMVNMFMEKFQINREPYFPIYVVFDNFELSYLLKYILLCDALMS